MTGDGEPALVVERLSKRFGARTAFEDVTFSRATAALFDRERLITSTK